MILSMTPQLLPDECRPRLIITSGSDSRATLPEALTAKLPQGKKLLRHSSPYWENYKLDGAFCSSISSPSAHAVVRVSAMGEAPVLKAYNRRPYQCCAACRLVRVPLKIQRSVSALVAARAQVSGADSGAKLQMERT